MDSTDQAMADRVNSGDTDAFRHFVRRYQDMGLAVAGSVLKDSFLAEEAVQESFIKAFSNLGKFSGRSSFKTWFYRIVVNEALKLRVKRKSGRLQFEEEYAELIVGSEEGNVQNMLERRSMIDLALRLLTTKEELAIRLFYLEGESVEGLCAITGWSATNAKVILHRARKNMHTSLSEIAETNK